MTTTRVSDCPPHEADAADAAEMAETSFRRGFDQGVAAALEAIEQGLTPDQLRAWKERLSAWRRKSCKKIVPPEWASRRIGADLKD